MERTLILLKPDAVKRGLRGAIISRFEAKSWQINAMKQVTPTPELAAAHYAEHAEEVFYAELVTFLCSGPIVALCVAGPGVIRLSRIMIGHFIPENCAPGTIRGDFATTRMENLIHGSDSFDAAERELAIWFTEYELNSYYFASAH